MCQRNVYLFKILDIKCVSQMKCLGYIKRYIMDGESITKKEEKEN